MRNDRVDSNVRAAAEKGENRNAQAGRAYRKTKAPLPTSRSRPLPENRAAEHYNNSKTRHTYKKKPPGRRVPGAATLVMGNTGASYGLADRRGPKAPHGATGRPPLLPAFWNQAREYGRPPSPRCRARPSVAS